MTQAVFRNVAAPLPLLVLAVSCLAAASALAQQKPVPGAVFGGSRGTEGNSPNPQTASRAAPSGGMFGPARNTAQWLARLGQASQVPAYSGTYVVWSSPGMLASSRIWRASNGGIQVERVDALSGEPRSTYRVTDQRGSHVETFLPELRVVRIDRSDTPGKEGGFPHLPDAGQGVSPADYYDARHRGQERVAGLMADVVQFVPRDDLRYGYRVWSEQSTGLAIKLQTLDRRGRLLEQAAFSGLTFNPATSVPALQHEMRRTSGWRKERVMRVATTARAEGWQIGSPAGQPVPGFAFQRCYRPPVPVRAADVAAGDRRAGDPLLADSAAQGEAGSQTWFQCVFSDGFAAVSVFIQSYDAARREDHHRGELDAAWGATHVLARRVDDKGWVTVVGEVPPQTLKRFAEGVSRLP